MPGPVVVLQAVRDGRARHGELQAVALSELEGEGRGGQQDHVPGGVRLEPQAQREVAGDPVVLQRPESGLRPRPVEEQGVPGVARHGLHDAVVRDVDGRHALGRPGLPVARDELERVVRPRRRVVAVGERHEQHVAVRVGHLRPEGRDLGARHRRAHTGGLEQAAALRQAGDDEGERVALDVRGQEPDGLDAVRHGVAVEGDGDVRGRGRIVHRDDIDDHALAVRELHPVVGLVLEDVHRGPVRVVVRDVLDDRRAPRRRTGSPWSGGWR